ncbi:MAG: hypothetical protein PWP08_680 [Methanofollis sp.]|nr:hypothetical protein [Methanofollis sp.]
MSLAEDCSAQSAIYPLTVAEALQRIAEIEIVVKRVSEEIGMGRHRSLFPGTGSDFREIREYRFGDDVRAIDWNTTARFCEPYLRVFTEEHDAAVYVVVDRSASGTFGSERSKDETIFEIAVSVLFSAQVFGDRPGLCLFTDGVEVLIPPGRGRRHLAVLLDALIAHRPASPRTDLKKTLSTLFSTLRREALIVLISDFDTESFGEELVLLSRRHEVRAIRVRDRTECELPDAGHLLLRDPETGEEVAVNTSDRAFRQAYRDLSAAREEVLAAAFGDAGVTPLEVFTDEDYAAALKTYFKLAGRVVD